jgi:hypothetical protein
VFDNAGMCGGYPASTLQYHYALKGAHLEEIAARGGRIPRRAETDGVTDPALAEFASQGSLDIAEGAYLGVFKDGDLFSHSYNSGGGFGDPIDREPEDVEKDVHRGLASTAISQTVNGVVLHEVHGVLRVDAEATGRRRQDIRAQRLANSVPVSEWYQAQRTRLQREPLATPVTTMYRESRNLSPRWWRQFVVFWDLEPSFEFLDVESEHT